MRISDWSSDVCSSDLNAREQSSAPKAETRKNDPSHHDRKDACLASASQLRGVEHREVHARLIPEPGTGGRLDAKDSQRQVHQRRSCYYETLPGGDVHRGESANTTPAASR